MDIKHILIIRFRRVGDSILALTLFHSLKKMFPEARIDFILNKEIAPLYDNHPDINKVITFDQEENKDLFKYLKKVYKITHQTHYDVIIDMRSTIKTLFFSLFSLSTPYRIGTKKAYTLLLHNYRIDNLSSDHLDKIQENLMLLKPLEQITPLQHVPVFHLFITQEENMKFRCYMQQQGINFSRPVILAAVTARLQQKVWPIQYTQEVLWRIIKKYNAQIVFNFADKEKETALKLHEEMHHSPNIFTNIEAKNLRELCALACNSNFFFGNEGGPRHLSQSFNVPSFAIYSPDISKTRWLPNQGERFQGISIYDVATPEEIQTLNYSQRWDLITVDLVWEKVDKMLEKFLQ